MPGSWPSWPAAWISRSTSATGGRPGRLISRPMLASPAMNGWRASRRPGGLRASRSGRRSTIRRRRSCTGSSGGPGSEGSRGCRPADDWRPGWCSSGRSWASRGPRSALSRGDRPAVPRGLDEPRHPPDPGQDSPRTASRAGRGVQPGRRRGPGPARPDRLDLEPAPGAGRPRAAGPAPARIEPRPSRPGPRGAGRIGLFRADRTSSASPGDRPAGPNGRWTSSAGDVWAIWRDQAPVGSRSERGSRRPATRIG